MSSAVNRRCQPVVLDDGLGEDLLRFQKGQAREVLEESGRFLTGEVHFDVLSVAQVPEEVSQEVPIFLFPRCRKEHRGG